MRGQQPQRGLAARMAGAVGDRGADPRRQLFVIGVAAIIVPLVLVGTALASLGEVNKAHAQADAITASQVDFLLADMAHDTMRGAVLAVARAETADDRAKAIVALDRNVRQFRNLLRDVDAADLPPEVTSALDSVRPVQDRYADHVLEFGRAAALDPGSAGDLVPDIEAQFDSLTPAQAVAPRR